MKKLLSILSTIILVETVSTNIIAYNNKNNSDIKYEINDKGEIIYNFQEKQAYIIGFTINSHIYESNIYVNNIPFKTTLSGQGTQYWTYININDNKAWTTGWYTNNLIYLKKKEIYSMEKIKKIEWKPNKKNIGEDWNIRVEHFLNESIFDPKNFFWQYKDNLNKKITKIKKNKWNKNSVFQSVDEKYYPPKSIFIEKTIENETVWLLPVERYKMGLSFYNKNYEINCIERLFNIKESQLLNKVTQFEDKLKIKSTLNQLKLNKNKEFKL